MQIKKAPRERGKSEVNMQKTQTQKEGNPMTTKVKAKNASITIPEGFFGIWNVMKLKRRTGYEGLCALFRLMLWAEKECPDGRLTSMDGEDIEIYADWRDGTYTLRTLDGYVRKEVQR